MFSQSSSCSQQQQGLQHDELKLLPMCGFGSSVEFAKLRGFVQYLFVQKLMPNPVYTEFWSMQTVDHLMVSRKLTVPAMLFVGQRDLEGSYGAPAVFSNESAAGQSVSAATTYKPV